VFISIHFDNWLVGVHTGAVTARLLNKVLGTRLNWICIYL